MNAGEGAPALKQLPEEDAGRANCYALIGRLFYGAPDSILLAELTRAEAESAGDDDTLGPAWRALREACRSADPMMLEQEYDSLFVGVGKSEVTPYTSHYVTGSSPDRHLVRLRERLEQLGLARCSAAFEVEDHVSGICDVMRILVVEDRPLEEQGLFFSEFAYPGLAPFCAVVTAATSAAFYRYVAEFASAFLEVEREAFEMHRDGA
jgi:TorA maturation chaperone TorD